MKSRLTTLDLISSLDDLVPVLVGMRVNQIYDIDKKTLLIRLQRPEEGKKMLLIESGTRLHTTGFEWPKSPAPSGFAMKLRKHINNKRLESMKQLGSDRAVDLKFGSDEAAYHVIVEFYDRGNIALCDHQYKILNILRPRVQGEEKFLVREEYPVEMARKEYEKMDRERLEGIVKNGKANDNLKKVLMPHFEYGPALLEHLLLGAGLAGNMKLGRDFKAEDGDKMSSLVGVFHSATSFVKETPAKGYIIQKKEMRPSANPEEGETEFFTMEEFHPYLFRQHQGKPFLEYDSFDKAVDEFYSNLESQKIEMKTVQQEKQAMKKLENVRKDHVERIGKLQLEQALDRRKAEMIEMNEDLVENALAVIRSAIANKMDWREIGEILKEAQENKDPVATRITKLKLEANHFTMVLTDPYSHLDQDEEDDPSGDDLPNELQVDIDIDLSAQANARRFYHQKKHAANKEQKTRESHTVAIKSAEKKTKSALKEMATITNIIKARKVFWFEKFFWFISSENYLVIAGRDMQQNELIVKRYMKPGDIYVHADLNGASSVVIKNPAGKPVPPKTLNEAGHMAICYSVAWENKIVAAAWWVESSQVSKTAPSGEYLGTGSFMIRGKKNFLLPSHLVLGFGFLFKLEDGSVERHKGERCVRSIQEEDALSKDGGDVESLAESVDEIEINVDDDDNSSGEEDKTDNASEVKDDKDERPDDGDAHQSNEEQDEDAEEEAKAKSSEEPDSEEEPSAFPDTNIDIQYAEGGKVAIKARGMSTTESVDDNQDEQTIVFSSSSGKKARNQQGKAAAKVEQEPQERPNKDNPSKRGKKGKLKKIKDKYKDQDEEEKEMRMHILQGSQKEKKKNRKNKGNNKEGPGEKKMQGQKQTKKPPPQSKPRENVDQGDALEEDETVHNVPAEVDMLESLTGIPVIDDELLFATPVVAPYNTMVNYKFKVKMTPGTGKRGKATKTALNIFVNDKTATQREKDLLKSVKDQDLARNLPGKVKLSAPQLHSKGNKKQK